MVVDPQDAPPRDALPAALSGLVAMTPETAARLAAIRAKALSVPEPEKGDAADNARKSQAVKLAHKTGRLMRAKALRWGKG